MIDLFNYFVTGVSEYNILKNMPRLRGPFIITGKGKTTEKFRNKEFINLTAEINVFQKIKKP